MGQVQRPVSPGDPNSRSEKSHSVSFTTLAAQESRQRRIASVCVCRFWKVLFTVH